MKKSIIAAISSLVISALAASSMLLAPNAGAAGLLVATQETNVRLAPNAKAEVALKLKKGETVVAMGMEKDGWYPVRVQKVDAFVNADYVKYTILVKKPSKPAVNVTTPTATPTLTAKATPTATPTSTPTAKPTATPTAKATPTPTPTPTTQPTVPPTIPPTTEPPTQPIAPPVEQLPKPVNPNVGATQTRYATEEVWVRTEANDNKIIAKLPTNSTVQITGKTVGIYSEILYNGALRYVRSIDLSDKVVTNTGWSKGLDRLKPNAAALVTVIRAKFPEIATIYGWRPYDPYPDHPSGRAIDLMIPRYKENTELGWRICQYLMEHAKEHNIRYLIYQQSYWDTSYGVTRKWKKMSNRGSDTANHYDHIHITTNQS